MKRFLAAVATAALLLLVAVCGTGVLADSSAQPPAAVPTASSSRNVRSEPVKVNETIANAETVDGTPAPSATDAPQATAAPADTPATGEPSVVYVAGVIGLILICSAGLLMLRRI